jgi:hypothetical protein
MSAMDARRVAMLRELLEATGWVDRTRTFARTIRTSTASRGGLLLVGTPDEEPWHLAAHLDDESRYSGIAEIAPTLVRWQVPPGAPAHLAVPLDRLAATRRGETVFVVAPEAAPEQLLERVSDARRQGATVVALDTGDTELEGLAHESLTVVEAQLAVPAPSFDTVQHLVSMAAGETEASSRRGRRGRPVFRDRLARALDVISGPTPPAAGSGWRGDGRDPQDDRL